MQSSRLVRAVFALLVVATVGAFVAAQALKTEVPVVLRFAAQPRHLSPNDDRVRDSTRVGFDLSEPADVSFSVIDAEGNPVREIAGERRLAGDTKHRFTWDGRDDDGRPVPDGAYRLRVVRRSQGRVLDSIKKVIVDTRPPEVSIASVTPNVISPGIRAAPKRIRIRYRGPRNLHPEFRVWHTDVSGPPRIARRFRGDRNRTGVWDGTVRGAPTPDGSYAFTVVVRDLAGNPTEAPAGPRPTARAARPRTGADVRRLTLHGPSVPVSAGSLAMLRVGPVARRFDYALSRLGSNAVLKTDRRRGGRLRVRIPANARTGVYLVRVRAAGRRAVWPVPVSGRPAGGRRALSRPRPLVILPVATWQGENHFDSDLDGFPDTLQGSTAVPADRPYDQGRLPAGLRREALPLLEFLDRERLPYDLTTDLALASREGPSLSNAPGVAIAGTETWVPRLLRDGLRREVEDGGLRVVSFGDRSLRRTVALVEGRLRDPSPARPDDLFGERTKPFRTDEAAPLDRQRDRLRLFRGADRLFGDFSRFERSVDLPADAELLTAAGRERDQAAFVGYRLGKGTVIRPGTPEWTRQLRESSLGLEVPRITKNIWRDLGKPR
ncbi:MAG: FlgD immunoglobulin-like domain containing protein [Thermoleophilaceae bacterium]